jgi:hypothetical protein
LPLALLRGHLDLDDATVVVIVVASVVVVSSRRALGLLLRLARSLVVFFVVLVLGILVVGASAVSSSDGVVPFFLDASAPAHAPSVTARQASRSLFSVNTCLPTETLHSMRASCRTRGVRRHRCRARPS